MKKLKKIPHFKSDAEEDAFWQTHDSTEYIDWSKAQRINFPNLSLTSHPITIRLPGGLLDWIRAEADKRDIPYQSFIKEILFDRRRQATT
ncbi:hypothetical protein A2690_05135 [Candidatus Roizmanbacteria bacterium RIFCSPHIGHO2_01_FULL_39_12b]|uniref:Uncharacterized protein n=1 Tax=Candidatus Roizmanbacteria bacterium RIFCSPHIGHO2_01_FULL_39_12b TaxID=1802030 RepID=A0A1F7G927_9BACT|nr:MAG: hypothetical protein A2690_05135 [Candidatus Roizmanbacteria bacterium RIFCSPHIGHO2_01_FULL_39_12b]OGK45906.1 MAG: hypothetical protein A3B46_03365 [Candidatus Roizmanbacteria bacterium RIFCSPLOWO2_01_FULL_39_19]